MRICICRLLSPACVSIKSVIRFQDRDTLLVRMLRKEHFLTQCRRQRCGCAGGHSIQYCGPVLTYLTWKGALWLLSQCVITSIYLLQEWNK